MKKLALLSFILILLPAIITAQDRDLKNRFYNGITAEEIEGDLDKAINIYQDILNAEDVDRQLAARCIYHIGLCHDKMESGQAMEYFTSLLEKYPDQGDLADLARNRITKLEDANTFIDPRDGHKYKYVQIGDQVWMAENLAFMPWVNPPKKQEYGIWVYDYDGDDVAEAKATENYQKYGCLYDWATAMDIDPRYLEEEWRGDPENHQGLCPPGWRMPSDDDWTELEKLLGLTDEKIEETSDPWWLGNRTGSGALKVKSTSGWLSGGNGNNELGLSILPGGNRILKDDPFAPCCENPLGEYGFFWVSEDYNDSLWSYPDSISPTFKMAQTRSFVNLTKGEASDDFYRGPFSKISGFSIRCIKSVNLKQSDKKESYLEKANSKKQGIAIEPNYIAIQPELISVIPRNDIRKDTVIFDSDTIIRAVVSYSKIVGHNLIYYTNSDSAITSYDLNNYTANWRKEYYVSGGFAICGDTLTFSDKRNVISINTVTGEEIRSFSFPEIHILESINDDKVIAQSRSRDKQYLFCIDRISGEKIWEYFAGDTITLLPSKIYDETIYIGINHSSIRRKGYRESDHPIMAAIDIRSGETKWTYSGQGRGFWTPTVIKNQVYCSNLDDQYLYVLNSKNGTLSWKYYMDRGGAIKITDLGNRVVFHNNSWGFGTDQAYCVDLQGNEIWKKKLLENFSTSWGVQGITSNYIYMKTGKSGESYLLLINKEANGDNWMIKMPEEQIGRIILTEDKFLIPRRDGINVYKYPELE